MVYHGAGTGITANQDGMNIGTTTAKTSLSSKPRGDGRVEIGRRVQAGGPFYASTYVDEVKMYNRQLSESKIQNWWSWGVCNPCRWRSRSICRINCYELYSTYRVYSCRISWNNFLKNSKLLQGENQGPPMLNLHAWIEIFCLGLYMFRGSFPWSSFL